MRDFVILGSSSIVTPPNPSSSSSSSSSHSLSQHRHTIKPRNSSLQKLTPSPPSSSNISCTLQLPLNRLYPQDAKLQDFEIDHASHFVPALNLELLATAVLAGIRGKKVRTVVDTLNKVQELDNGISLSTHFDASAMDIIGKECSSMVKCGHIQEAVELMEVSSYQSEN